jgi:hypothetical protein
VHTSRRWRAAAELGRYTAMSLLPVLWLASIAVCATPVYAVSPLKEVHLTPKNADAHRFTISVSRVKEDVWFVARGPLVVARDCKPQTAGIELFDDAGRSIMSSTTAPLLTKDSAEIRFRVKSPVANVQFRMNYPCPSSHAGDDGVLYIIDLKEWGSGRRSK